MENSKNSTERLIDFKISLEKKGNIYKDFYDG